MDTSFFHSFSQVVASFGLLLSSLLGHRHTATTAAIQQPIAVQVASTSAQYVVTKRLSYQGYQVTMNASVPKDGGDITGIISGDCTGNITGHYDGKNAGVIKGQANPTCGVSLFQIPATVTFTGTVNRTAKDAQLLITFHVASFQKSENVTVPFH